MPHNNFIRLKKGCPSAFAAIHAKYSRSIFWVGKRLIQDDFVIESLVQDAFLKLWVHRDRIENPEHIYFFLRFVMKRECISYYTRPRNKFSRQVHSLDSFDNYQDYMVGYDPKTEAENLKTQEREQQYFNRIKQVLPLLNPESSHLIALCLKYGFQYKAISEAMGISIPETTNKVKKAITDIKTIINQGYTLESAQRPTIDMKVQGVMTEEQAEVLKLRCVEKYSFAAIATALNLSQDVVHREFMAAYKLLQNKHQQQSA